METIGERARSNGMSVSEMLRVYAASGSCVTIPLDPQDMRSFAQFLEFEGRADEISRITDRLETALNDEVLENYRIALWYRRLSGWSLAISMLITAGWIGWIVANF